MKKYWQKIGWKDHTGKWDKYEIIVDIICLSVFGLMLYSAIFLMKGK